MVTNESIIVRVSYLEQRKNRVISPLYCVPYNICLEHISTFLILSTRFMDDLLQEVIFLLWKAGRILQTFRKRIGNSSMLHVTMFFFVCFLLQ